MRRNSQSANHRPSVAKLKQSIGRYVWIDCLKICRALSDQAVRSNRLTEADVPSTDEMESENPIWPVGPKNGCSVARVSPYALNKPAFSSPESRLLDEPCGPDMTSRQLAKYCGVIAELIF